MKAKSETPAEPKKPATPKKREAGTTARELTPKQSLFALEYLVDLNATQAAIRAGYSPKTAEQQGYQLLQKPSVQAAIAARQKEREQRTAVTADRVLLEAARLNAVLSAQISEVRREVARMGLKAEDE